MYSVFGPRTAAKPISDTNSLKVLWEAPNSSIPFLAGVISDKHNMLGITDTHGFSEEKVEFKDVNFFFLPASGMRTWSMRWMTPLVVTMSFFSTILMPLTVRLSPSQPISMVLPSAVSYTEPAMMASEHWTLFNRWYFASAGWVKIYVREGMMEEERKKEFLIRSDTFQHFVGCQKLFLQ